MGNILKYYNLELEDIKNRLFSKNNSLKIIYVDLGLAYYMLDNIPNATNYYEKSLNIDDKVSVSTYSDLIYVYSNITKEYEKAKDFALEALEIVPDDYIVISNLAEVYVGLGDKNLAKKLFLKALEIETELEPAMERLSKI